MDIRLKDHSKFPTWTGPLPLTIELEVTHKNMAYTVLLNACCGRPYIVASVYNERSHQHQRAGRLRTEIMQVASQWTEAWLDRIQAESSWTLDAYLQND